jgi:colanic acid biosynthesis glycosyl transferase WcaI
VHTGFAPFDDHLLAETWCHVARAEPGAWLLTAGRRVAVLDERARATGSSARVRQLGTLPYHALGEVMAAGSVMALPYSPNPHNQARFPNRAGDYFAAGRPLVTNPTGDLAALVATHGIGVLAPAEPHAFAAAIVTLLRDEPRMREIGVRARAFAEGDGSWSARADELERLYVELLADVGRSMSSS